MARDGITRIWDNNGNPIGGIHDTVRFAIGDPEYRQLITVTMEEDHVIIRGNAPRPTIVIEPQASNTIAVTLRDFEK